MKVLDALLDFLFGEEACHPLPEGWHRMLFYGEDGKLYDYVGIFKEGGIPELNGNLLCICVDGKTCAVKKWWDHTGKLRYKKR